jgi:hypothetical protein
MEVPRYQMTIQVRSHPSLGFQRPENLKNNLNIKHKNFYLPITRNVDDTLPISYHRIVIRSLKILNLIIFIHPYMSESSNHFPF